MEAYMATIILFAGNFAPVGWALCDGQILPISQNEALFSVIGTQYGGDGKQTFALPDLRKAVPGWGELGLALHHLHAGDIPQSFIATGDLLG